MAERYIVVNGSQSAHCCFVATVVDTTKPGGLWGGEQHYDAVCECFSDEDAQRIAAALNATVPQSDAEGEQR